MRFCLLKGAFKLKPLMRVPTVYVFLAFLPKNHVLYKLYNIMYCIIIYKKKHFYDKKLQLKFLLSCGKKALWFWP